ncbi:MAG: M48 family metalloprotease, partial [Myxococcales bacterium]
LLLGLSWFLRRLERSGRFGFDGERDVAGLPAAMFFIWLLITVASPVSATFSRASETRADQYALELLKQPEEFRSLMVKLAKVNMANLQPPWWTSTLLASHPKVIDRIAHAERFARENGLALQPPSPELFRVPMLSAAPKPQAVSAPAE